MCVHVVAAAGGELFEQLSAKGHYRERDAASIMRTLLQVRQTRQHMHGSCLHGSAVLWQAVVCIAGISQTWLLNPLCLSFALLLV